MRNIFLTTLLLLFVFVKINSNNNFITGDVYEVHTHAIDGVTFFVIENNNIVNCNSTEKIGFYVNGYYDSDLLMLSQVNVEYDVNSKSIATDSNLDDIITYIATDINVVKIRESNWS